MKFAVNFVDCTTAGFLNNYFLLYLTSKKTVMRKLKFEYFFTGLYLLLGSLWIVFSDRLLILFFNDPVVLTQFQTYKGWFFVAATSVIFYIILKKHLVKLRTAEQKARESDKLKTSFLQNISHEVRTPMNSIIGFSELVKDENLNDEKRAEYLRIINLGSLQLLNVINSIIDISMIESGNLMISEKKVDLNSLIEELYLFFQPMIKPEISFFFQKGFPEKTFIITDEHKLKKILSNILSNAIKFTDEGHITFGYTLKGEELEFFTEDTGIGIPEDFRENIFNRFRKAENGTDRIYDGLGLGLSICKGNLDILKGRMWVKSLKGNGSKFFFTIPYKPA
jgi:signal transduction histidine kinase